MWNWEITGICEEGSLKDTRCETETWEKTTKDHRTIKKPDVGLGSGNWVELKLSWI